MRSSFEALNLQYVMSMLVLNQRVLLSLQPSDLPIDIATWSKVIVQGFQAFGLAQVWEGKSHSEDVGWVTTMRAGCR